MQPENRRRRYGSKNFLVLILTTWIVGLVTIAPAIQSGEMSAVNRAHTTASVQLSARPTPIKVTPAPMNAKALETHVMPAGLPPNRNSLVSIVYNGYRRSSLEPCGCVSHKLGGIDREAAVIDAISSGGLPILKVEAGGYVRDRAEQSQNFRVATKHLLQALAAMDYDAFNVSVMDMEIGKDFLTKALGPKADRLISANVVDLATSAPMFATYRIVPVTLRDGTQLRFGITGITRARLGLVVPGSPAPSYGVVDPVEALKKVLPELEKKFDIVILLAYMNREALANDVLSKLDPQAKLDIAIAGEYMGNRNDVENVRGVRVVSGGFEGRQVGHLVLEIRDGKINQQFNKLVEIEQTIPPKPDISRFISDYLTELVKGGASESPASSKPDNANLQFIKSVSHTSAPISRH